jgi:hypothetical protein
MYREGEKKSSSNLFATGRYLEQEERRVWGEFGLNKGTSGDATSAEPECGSVGSRSLNVIAGENATTSATRSTRHIITNEHT